MTTDAPSDEVNAWDLCHHLLREGFGVAGVVPPEFAEPDLEQRWTFGSPAEHTLALTRSCDAPEPPDGRLPSGGSGPYWFRDSDHSQLERGAGLDRRPERSRPGADRASRHGVRSRSRDQAPVTCASISRGTSSTTTGRTMRPTGRPGR